MKIIFIMKNKRISSLLSALLLGVCILPSALVAQTGLVELDRPKFDDLPSPEINVVKNKKFKAKDWLEVEMKFKVKMDPRKFKEDFVDKVTVKWYVAVKVQVDGKEKVRLLEKEVNYVNVPVDEDLYASVYLSPAAVKRISGGDRAAKSIVEAVGGEIRINGSEALKKSGFFTTLSKSKGAWWEELSPYNKIPLRNKNETPFKFLWWDRYPEIEERR